MIHRASFRRCLAVVAALFASGCCTRSTAIETFAWPDDVECPAPDEAAFYITGYLGSHECGPHLIRVDGPAERTDDGCSYRVVVEDCSCSDPHQRAFVYNPVMHDEPAKRAIVFALGCDAS